MFDQAFKMQDTTYLDYYLTSKRQDLLDEQAEIVLDPTKKSANDNLIKNLDNCLTPELKLEVNQCLNGYRVPD